MNQSEDGVVRMLKQKDRIDFVVAQIVADGDQDVAQESAANCDAKEGENKDNGNGDDKSQIADTPMDIEPNETAPGNRVDAAHDGSPLIGLQDADSLPSDDSPHQSVRQPLDVMLKTKDKCHIRRQDDRART